MADPIHQFELKTIGAPLFKIGGSDVVLTNSALFMFGAVGFILLLMMMWLVTVNPPGIMPARLSTRMKMNSEKTSGKNFIPSWPAELLTVSATNS